MAHRSGQQVRSLEEAARSRRQVEHERSCGHGSELSRIGPDWPSHGGVILEDIRRGARSLLAHLAGVGHEQHAGFEDLGDHSPSRNCPLRQ